MAKDNFFNEKLPEQVSIKHKVTFNTEKKTFHLHEQLEIVFALSNNLECQFEEKVVKLPQYSMILLDTMKLHYMHCNNINIPCDRYVVYFPREYVQGLSTSEYDLFEGFMMSNINPESSLIQIPNEYKANILNIFIELDHYKNNISANNANSYGREMHIKLLLARLLLIITQFSRQQYNFTSNSIQYDHYKLINNVLRYISKNYQNDIQTKDITSEFGVSKTHLYNLFVEITGKTLFEYINDYRMAKAKDYLLNSDKSIEDISILCGYGTISSFSRVFKTNTKLSPLQYRKKNTIENRIIQTQIKPSIMPRCPFCNNSKECKNNYVCMNGGCKKYMQMYATLNKKTSS